MSQAQIGKVKNAKGRIVGYTATIGAYTVDAPTPAEAKAVLETEINAALERLALGTTIRVWRGHTIVVSPDTYGWSYWLDIFSDRFQNTLPRRTDRAVRADRDAAVSHALAHLAQVVWSLDVSDDRQFVEDLPIEIHSDLLSWFKWQRSYARLRADGYTDADAHRMAGYEQPTAQIA